MRPPVDNKVPWLGTFVTVDHPEELIEFFMVVGHTKENATKFTNVERTFTLSQEEDGQFGHNTEFEGFSKGVTFRLGEKFTYPAAKRAAGVTIAQVFDWDQDSRTLFQNVKSTDGFEFNLDYVFDEDYNSAYLVQRSAVADKQTSVSVKQRLKRIK